MKKPKFPFAVGQMVTVYKNGKDSDKAVIDGIETRGIGVYMKTTSQGFEPGAVVYYVLENAENPLENGWRHSITNLTGQHTIEKNLLFSFAPRR